MCGIAGFVGMPHPGDPIADIKRMLGQLANRGPDDEGIYDWRAQEVRGPRVILGNRRLAVLDRSDAGHQPMTSPDGRFTVTLNGEIYNYLELREELTNTAWRFRSQTDTEVLLAAYAMWGPRCLDRISGMFAFAILDSKRRKLFLARDPFGIKPLYYVSLPRGIVFGSEIAPLLDWPGVVTAPNAQAVYDYLDRGVLDIHDQTAFAGVKQLPPGHAWQIDVGTPSGTPVLYWQPSMETTLELSFDEAVAEYRRRFLEGVVQHLRSDVPVGTLLSGGLDSSAIVMAMREVGGAGLEIQTFSFLSGPGGVNEQRWIDDVNRAAGAIPHKVTLEAEDWWSDRAAFTAGRDEPIPNPVVYVQQRLFAAAREAGCVAVLTGQGSDELNAGYAWYRAPRFATDLRAGRFGRAVSLGSAIAKREGVASVRSISRGLFLSSPQTLQKVAWRLRPSPSLVNTEWVAHENVTRRSWPVLAQSVFRDRIGFRLSVGLPDLLRFEDRSAMAVSVEARVPLLTRELADFVFQLPAHYLIGRKGETKNVMRAAVRGLVPDSVLARPTRVGFSIPLRPWLTSTGGAEPFAAIADLQCIDPRYARRLQERLAASRLRPSEVMIAWRLLGLAGWAERFGITV